MGVEERKASSTQERGEYSFKIQLTLLYCPLVEIPWGICPLQQSTYQEGSKGVEVLGEH